MTVIEDVSTVSGKISSEQYEFISIVSTISVDRDIRAAQDTANI